MTAAKIANGAITEPKLADNAVSYRANSLKIQAGVRATGPLGALAVVFAPVFSNVPTVVAQVESALAQVWTVRILAVNVNGFTATLERNDAGTSAAGSTSIAPNHDHDVTWQNAGGPGGFLAGLVGLNHTQIDAFTGQTDVDMVQGGGSHQHATSVDATTTAPLGVAGVNVYWTATLQE